MTAGLLHQLRRSADAELRRVGDLLAPLAAADHLSQPRASEALASFLAAQDSPLAAASADHVSGPAPLLVLLGTPPAAAKPPPRRRWMPAPMRHSLLAKVVAVAAVALAGGVAVAATVGPGDSHDVVVTPAQTSEPQMSAGTDDHEGRAPARARGRTPAPASTHRAHAAGTTSPATNRAAPPTSAPTTGPAGTSSGRHGAPTNGHAATIEPSHDSDSRDDDDDDDVQSNTPTATPSDDSTSDGGAATPDGSGSDDESTDRSDSPPDDGGGSDTHG
jgi:hypothetical protein